MFSLKLLLATSTLALSILGKATGNKLAPSSSLLNCPKTPPISQPASLYDIALYPVTPFPDVVSTESIRNTITTYLFAVDSHNWPALRNFFVPDAQVLFSDPVGVIQGIDNITSAIVDASTPYAQTLHTTGGQYIAVCPSLVDAVSVTYFEATAWLTNTTAPEMVDDDLAVYVKGRYEDIWGRKRDGAWRIVERKIVFMGPMI